MNDVIALYPTARKVEDWLMRHSRGGALLDYPIVTFPQLVDRLWREFGPRGALLDELQERLAAGEAMSAQRDALGAARGGAGHVLGLIRQFKSAALTAADLRAAARAPVPGHGADGAAIRARLDGLAEVFERYERLLAERGLSDRHDRERVVLERLLALEHRGARPSLLEGVRQLQIAEIYDFSLLQFMIVTTLIRMVGDATLTIQAAEHPAGAARFADLTWNRFVAEESIADKVLPAFVRRGGRFGRLGFVLEHLFLETADAAPPADQTLEVVEAPTPLGEIEEVGRAIRRAMESPEPIAPGRIAVVARDLEPYANHLRTVFRRYRIPLAIGHAPAPRASAPARLIVEILRAPRDRFRRESMVALCRSPHLTAIAPGIARALDEIGYVDASAQPLIDRFRLHFDDLRSAIERTAAGSDERRKLQWRLARAERARAAFEPMLEALEPLAGHGTLAEHLGRLEYALDALGFNPASLPGHLDDDTDDAADDAARAWGPVRAALDGLARWAALGGGGRVVDCVEFAALVETAFDCAAGPADSAVAGAVVALPVLEARGLDFDMVFVIGLNDGVFPSYHPDDPLLPDEIKLALNRPLGEALRRRFGANAPTRAGGILRTRYERNGEDFLLFFLALSMPSRRVVLSYAAAEAGGNPMVRSPFVDEVLRLLGDPRETAAVRRISASGVVPAIAECLSRDEFLARAAAGRMLESAEAEAIEDRATLDSVRIRSDIERAREQYLAMPTREEYPDPDDQGLRYSPNSEKFALASNRDGRVAPDARLARMLCGDPAAPKAWSATRLGELAACGFKFFAGRVLALSEDEEPDYELSALEGGELIHDLLRRLVEQVDFGDPPGARAHVPEVLKAARAERRPLARDQGFFDLRWRSIERTAEEFVEAEIAYRAANPEVEILTEHQIRFALNDLSDPGRVRLWLEGRIDRLELHPGRGGVNKLRVLDYKDSRSADRYRKLKDSQGAQFGWTDFQLPVYLMGALDEFGGRLTADATLEAGYLVLRNRQKEQVSEVARALVDPDPKRRAAAAKSNPPPVAERIIALVGEALAGRFDVDPRQCDDWCPYRTVCRYYQAAEPAA
ncbi:MAG TPA: PD-(D/E)XK nuclease family protein [Candidatus Binataceae bacterium]|nr:PD-(D/E)XK nuclease family protein [Candidatus Binataceae bacterium]